MKLPAWVLRILSYTELCIGFCLLGFIAIAIVDCFTRMFFFTIGLGNVFVGAIFHQKAMEAKSQ